MRAGKDYTAGGHGLPSERGQRVSLFVSERHPLLQLKGALDWERIGEVMVRYWRAAGKNVDGRPGAAWPIGLYVPLLVLMAVKALNSRQMEEYCAENGVARVFLGLTEQGEPAVRDHSNIARAQAALGTQGWQEVNQLIVAEAVRLGFGRGEVVSADTTVQEPQIGYPHEAGILRGIAQRVLRSLRKLHQQGCRGTAAARAKAKEVLRSVKHYHLLAKTKEDKDQVLQQIVHQTQALIAASQAVSKQVPATTSQAVRSAVAKLHQMAAVTHVLIPQIQQWLATGVVASGKILHAGITTARAIVKNKVGKKVEFGLKWLMTRIEGGYVLGTVVPAYGDERQMPLAALSQYREVFGPTATPQLLVYDRGGSAATTVKKLQQAGIPKVGIEPMGKAAWSIAAADQKKVKSQRAKIEGSIGALKSPKYAFNHGRQRNDQTLVATGQWALVCLNVNKLMRDLVGKAQKAQAAAA
jgi:transposase, IS5 family